MTVTVIMIFCIEDESWNFLRACVTGFYQQLVEDLLLCPEAPVLVFMSSSAHPAMWIAGRCLKSVPWIELDIEGICPCE